MSPNITPAEECFSKNLQDYKNSQIARRLNHLKQLEVEFKKESEKLHTQIEDIRKLEYIPLDNGSCYTFN